MNHGHEHHQHPTHHASSTKSGNREWLWTLLKDLEKLGDEYLVEKTPYQLPANITDILVKAAPYVTIVMLIVALPMVVAVLGIGAILSALAPVAGLIFVISMLFTLLGFVLRVKSVKPLFARERQGWNLVFYASLLSFVSSILGGSIVMTVITTLIGLYLLFQIKSYYK